ncbi:hypothetical protein GOB93_14205 [Acetobacter musti]|uniref:Uncharacterized protein n=1 Tax=Acetobacter musti TaxID=864732 RepID=A0ABX0JRZ5_9PROT|nr:hypothetical protein [Acetobacter musti]NHN85785.1 hypothetical protein [Acetobacter musti]
MTVVQFPGPDHNNPHAPASIDPIIEGMLEKGGEQAARAEFWIARQRMAVAFSRWVYLSNDVNEIAGEHGDTDHMMDRIWRLWSSIMEPVR